MSTSRCQINTDKIPQKISLIKVFCQISSIRGISKIYSSQSRFERTLWSGFVILMTGILILTMILLIQSYLQYTTAWHTTTEVDSKTAFPALTFCAQNPFSKIANSIWINRSILSPSELQDNLTLLSLEAIDNTHIEGLSELRLYDLFTTYYMNLTPNDSIRISHSRDMLKYCILIYNYDIIVAEKCDMRNESFQIKLFSSDQFFNCYTIEGEQESTVDLVGIIVLLKLIPSYLINELKNSFLMDFMLRGEGLKVLVHEPKTFPDIEHSGVNLHPEKMNSLVYTSTKWIRLNTPVKPCRDNQEGFVDLNQSFLHTFTHCKKRFLQWEFINNCRCMLSNIPRPFLPNQSFPYCLKLVPIHVIKLLHKRFQCISKINNLTGYFNRHYENKLCYLRCTFTTYDTSTSTTTWYSDETKLYNIQQLYRSYMNYRQDKNKNNIKRIKNILKQSLEKSKILRKMLATGKSFGNNITNAPIGSGYTYLSLMRKNHNLDIKTEKLVLEFNTLVSRIGGLTSICIGLTAAVFAEIVEFIYVLHRKSCQNNQSEENKRLTDKTFYECNKSELLQNSINHKQNNAQLTCKNRFSKGSFTLEDLQHTSGETMHYSNYSSYNC